MAKHDENIAPFHMHARKWTRVADYLPDADAQPFMAAWSSGPAAPHSARLDRRKSARGLWAPIAAVAAAALLGLWGSGVLQTAQPTRPIAASSSRGLVFGLCDQGGLTNCVSSGDSFYLGGKTVRIATIEAPQQYGAACPREARLAEASAKRLQAMLNSGEVELAKVPQNLDAFGLMLRRVSVDGRDVGQAMVSGGFAREIGDLTRTWC